MNQDLLKQNLATSACEFITEKMIIGLGSGSTIHYFIKALASIKHLIEGVVCSSIDTTNQVKALNIPILTLNEVLEIPIYFDSADAFTRDFNLVKGGGGALTREKILQYASKKFICLVDSTKEVKVLGDYPIAIEVLTFARSFVAREIIKLKGNPVYRNGFVTDNGNIILEIHHWSLFEPKVMENKLNSIPGTLENGIFANKKPDILMISHPNKIEKLVI
ncbi:MAG: rpiA [Francisellaceae bacterium]|nr:rpiA [Francisellaceae bacterium]